MDHEVLAKSFLDPRLFRSEIEELEKGYKNHTISLGDLNQTIDHMLYIKGQEFLVDPRVMNRVDQMTGFNRIWNEYLKNGRREYGLAKSDLRNIWFKETKGNLNFLTYEYENEGPVVVGVIQQGKNLVLPSRVAIWASLYCHRHQIRAEFNSTNIEKEIDLNLKPHSNQFELLAGDEMQFKVNLLWDQGRSSSLVTSSYVERLVCMNGTYANDYVQSTAVSSKNSDLGAFRQSMEKGITKELGNFEIVKTKLEEIYTKPVNNLLKYSETWLKNKHVPQHIREEIIEELREGPHEVMGDFFNAITLSRHRIREQGIDLDSDGGDRYLGYLAGKLIGNMNKKDTSLEFLRKYVSPFKKEAKGDSYDRHSSNVLPF